MAQNDFISEYYSPGDIGFGVSVLNSSLSNPLISSAQCRSIDPSFQTAINYSNHFWLKDPQYKNIPFTKTISQRIWVRVSAFTSNTRGSGPTGACLMAKHSTLNSFFTSPNTSTYPKSGYELHCNMPASNINIQGNDVKINFSAGGVNAPVSTVSNIASININTWIGIRMDVIPLVGNVLQNNNLVSGTTGDLVQIYTASLATPNSWQQVYSTQIGTGDGRYVPWSNYTIKSTEFASVTGMNTDAYNGFAVAASSGYSDTSYKSRPYWDDYQIHVIDAFP